MTRRREVSRYDLGGHIPFVRDDGAPALACASCWATSCAGWTGRSPACATAAIVAGRYLDQRPGRPVALGAADGTAAGELGAASGRAFVDG